MKKIILFPLIVFVFLLNLFPLKTITANASEDKIVEHCKSYVLMDKDSGKILNESNSEMRLPIASIVKLMTILLTLEEIENGNLNTDDMISVSENASGMGGSQVFLDANCEYKVGELLKSVIVCSANDSSVALAEHIAGTEQMFVRNMNKKAQELKLNNTNYENATGLPCTNQYSCAKDVGIILKHVLDYPLYQEYSKIWLEDFVHPSGRTTEMTNTNKLSRFYDGCLGGKTGSTNEAKYCLGVGAKRDSMSLIAVVLGCDTSKDRFDNARSLLNYGFSNYENKILFDNSNLENIKIKMVGQDEMLELIPERNSNIVLSKNTDIKVSYNYNIPSKLTSVNKNEVIGYVDIIIDGEKYDSVNLLASKDFDKPGMLDYLKRIQKDFA